MVGPFCFAFIWFRVQGSGVRWRLRRLFIGRCSKVVFKSPGTSHSYDTREGIVSHAWYEILRLSPHLFFPHIERFRPLRMTIRGRALIWVIRCVFWELAVLYYDTSRPLETEVPQRDFRVWPNPKRRLACPLRRLPVRPNGPRRRRRMDPRSGVKDHVRLPVSLKRHPDRSGGILPADR